MIFITSDTHGEIERFDDKQYKQVKRGDTLIILGDFGFIWKNSKEQKKYLKKIAKMPFRTLFIDGLNEDFETLSEFETTDFFGAKASEIVKDKVFYIHRGEIFELDDAKILCFGGTDNFEFDLYSDKYMPVQSDFDNCMINLEKHNFNVDYILTHIPSGNISRFINLGSYTMSAQMDFFDTLESKVTYKKWYFGSIHQDKYVSPKVQSVYTDVKLLGL